jgi:hypothetical protein
MRSDMETFAEAAARLRDRIPRQSTDSADLIRQDRDREHADCPDHETALPDGPDEPEPKGKSECAPLGVGTDAKAGFFRRMSRDADG